MSEPSPEQIAALLSKYQAIIERQGRELREMRSQLVMATTALRRICSLEEKNVPKYAQQIAGEALTEE